MTPGGRVWSELRGHASAASAPDLDQHLGGVEAGGGGVVVVLLLAGDGRGPDPLGVLHQRRPDPRVRRRGGPQRSRTGDVFDGETRHGEFC